VSMHQPYPALRYGRRISYQWPSQRSNVFRGHGTFSPRFLLRQVLAAVAGPVATCGPGRGRSGASGTRSVLWSWSAAGGGRTAEMGAGSTGDGTGCVPATAPNRKRDRNLVYWFGSKQNYGCKSLSLITLHRTAKPQAARRVSGWN
jgi:hypothetical protein